MMECEILRRGWSGTVREGRPDLVRKTQEETPGDDARRRSGGLNCGGEANGGQ